MDLAWWVSVVEIPPLAGLFWLLQSPRAAMESVLGAVAAVSASAARRQ
jgi:hypothetical protein